MIGSAPRVFALLPEAVKGAIDWYCRPGLAAGFGPLNGPRLRQRMIGNLLKLAEVACIVETGTYRGTSTAFFSEFGLPIFTVESNFRYYTYSRIRLRKLPHVTVVHQDSVAFLRDRLPHARSADETILRTSMRMGTRRRPRGDELHAIFGHFARQIIVIDDFELPDNPGDQIRELWSYQHVKRRPSDYRGQRCGHAGSFSAGAPVSRQEGAAGLPASSRRTRRSASDEGRFRFRLFGTSGRDVLYLSLRSSALVCYVKRHPRDDNRFIMTES